MTNVVRKPEALREIAGSQMSVLQAGTGEAVLLGHSYLWDAEMWRPQIEALSRRYRVIVPELWGHGGSGPLPAGTRDLRDIARQHLEMMDRLGIERFAVVGLSVGGMWAAELALQAPERVSALVLMDTFVGPEPATARQRYFHLLDVIASTPEIPAVVLDAIVPMFFSPGIEERRPDLPCQLRMRLARWDRQHLLDSVVPLGRMIFGRRNLLDELPRLRMPRLVITGSLDIPRPLDEARLMADMLGCHCIEVPGAGHISSLESPQAITDHLVDFLSNASR